MKRITRAIENYFKRPFFRYSKTSYHLRSLFEYNGIEKVLYQAMNFIYMNKIEGDYVEFGVSKGDSFIPAYHISKMLGFPKREGCKNMKFWAFDSFEGLPKPEGKDKEFEWKGGEYACSVDKFKKILKKAKVNLNEVEIVEGWFENSLKKKQKRLNKIAIAFFDGDYYDSAKLVLEYIKPYLQTGTVLVFDDYYCFKADPNYGERRAFIEFQKNNPQFEWSEVPCFNFKKIFICYKK